MPADRVKVIPNTPAAVGMKHPHDCPLDEAGSDWPLDSFTCRRLADESIRRVEIETAPAAVPGKAAKVKATASDAASDAEAPAA